MQVLYHDEVKVFIKKLQKPTRSKIVRGIELIELYGQTVGMPHVKKIAKHLFELRIRGREEIRIFYCFENNSAILLHGFVKKAQKTPKHEIVTAERRFRLLT